MENEIVFNSDTAALDPATDPSASMMFPESNENEPEGLTFYHMDLYESKGRLEIFPEEPAGSGDGALGETSHQSTGPGEDFRSSDQSAYDLEKEVDELTKLYGLDEDKEIEQELLGGNIAMAGILESKETPAHKEGVAAGSYDSIYNAPKSSSPVNGSQHKKHMESTEEQELPGQDSEDESQHLHNGRAYDELHNHAHSEEELRRDGWQDEKSIQPNSEEEAADIYCATCKFPIRAFDKLFGDHKDHEVTQLANAVESAKEEIQKNMCKLEEQVTEMENFASHLEEIFITVEENFGRQEQNFEMHYNEVMQTLTQKYEEKVEGLGEGKKQKLEALYGQLVSCGENLDTCKELMETIQELCKDKEKADFIKAAVPMVDRLGEFLKKDMDLELSTLPDFEDTVIDFSDVQQLMDSINSITAPSAPVINPQALNSATGTSVRVCWGLFSDDTVEFYQLYYKQVSDDTPSKEQAELMIKVKETYCTVTNLVPNTQYEFWVSALNTAGISPVSERAVYVTAPSPPIIKRKESRSCENAALVCWESGNMNPVDSYTVELSKLTNGENGDIITESIVGIPNCEALIQLEPEQSYIISVRAVNMGGPSERSEPGSIHTTGTYFYLNEDTAHPLLSVLEDGLTIACSEIENLECDLPFRDNGFTRCIAILGSMIPLQGKHYWEVKVDENMEYRVGVAFENTHRHGYLGANSSSWCMRHIVTPARHKYEFLHSGTTPDIRITIPPKRIGILLDYDNWKLSFFNLDIAQHLYTFNSHFQHYVHPCFALEKPGFLKICNGIAIPTSITLL
ncbi:fibronectin type III and SPRY domain-containing protein 2 [Dermochelys coriacea]|uniref:fibronectin type III and SPRY domain-containing protein 2 n=1 Tax=Dermochelys coriacea TaxID=27794 RepID=UPI0018E6F056|nr:fibronectin type III and SPRY domain-containing protein 2 [Dermochelys coriacea]